MEPIRAVGYFYVEPNKPFERREFVINQLAPDEVVVKVAGCGLCHTDISFLTGSVKTKKELPLVLGHEISGNVIATGTMFAGKKGKNVIIPAVLPCGECELCRSGRDNICQHQKMPGNDFHGGFATHIVVPGRSLCELPENLGGFSVSELSVVADAVTTPYQSLIRSKLKKGELAIVIGTGGIGIYMVQHARNVGARVIAVDIDDKKLENARKNGADFAINASGLAEKDLKNKIRGLVQEHQLAKYAWRIFETSGTGAGQNTAFSLLNFAGTLGVIGFTMDKLQLRLSNIMAFDADVFGNWGCSPSHYPAVVHDILNGKINLKDNIEEHPLAEINAIITRAMEHKIEKRVIFKP